MPLMNGKASVIAGNIRKKKASAEPEYAGADSGDAGGAKTSTTGNKTKTGGSNPGGASTGGAGTVTVSISGSSSTETSSGAGAKKGSGKGSDKGSDKPITLNISNVGGKTDARNHGGMDPGDKEEDQMMMSKGGMVSDEPETAEADLHDEDFLSAEQDDDPKLRMRSMLKGIMRGLHNK